MSTQLATALKAAPTDAATSGVRVSCNPRRVPVAARTTNMPTRPEAIAVFQKSRLLYSPGKASNAGGVATSGLEMSQNSIRNQWTAEQVDNELHRIMSDIHKACLKYGTEPDGYINYVKGANIAGFIKVANAMIDQGLV